MARRYKYSKRTYKRPKRGSASTPESKARSLQVCWRNATGRKETLTMADAKRIVDAPPVCPYCKEAIGFREISIDHMQPRSRGGADAPSNLVFACRDCNGSKGNMTAEEFTALMDFLKDWPEMRESILVRLRAGGAAFRRRGRRR